MSGEPKLEFLLNSELGLLAGAHWMKALFEEHKHVRLVAKPGRARSLDQNALLNVWCRELCTYLLKGEKPTDQQVQDLKDSLKGKCYADTAQPWLVYRKQNMLTGQQRLAVTSSRKWLKGECTFFLDWLQHWAAEHGLVLEARGEYAEIKRGQVA